MITQLARVTIVVKDIDEALQFYTQKLGLVKRADDSSIPGLRWVTVSPKDQKSPEIVLQKPGPPFHDEETVREMLQLIGKNPTWVLYTDDCNEEYERLRSKGVKFLAEPEEKPYGIEALFQDLYGNMYSLVGPKHAS